MSELLSSCSSSNPVAQAASPHRPLSATHMKPHLSPLTAFFRTSITVPNLPNPPSPPSSSLTPLHLRRSITQVNDSCNPNSPTSSPPVPPHRTA